jgi:thiamine-monophosphate kinase
LNEFELINHFFRDNAGHRDDVDIGIGDDAAVLTPPPDKQIVTTVDTLIEAVHFPESTSAYDIGHKSLAVNLSDLAAMGAEPAWFTLALTLPEKNEDWLSDFTRGLSSLANRHNVMLIGGDTTRGDLSITIQATGFVEKGKAVLRSGAKPGELLFVTGTLGDAWLGLQSVNQNIELSATDQQTVKLRLDRPTPRVQAGQLLSGTATSMIDISDGLLGDLGHILNASNVGAELDMERLPLSFIGHQYLRQGGDIIDLVTGGDDYELCFTLPVEKQLYAQTIAKECGCPVTCIGKIVARRGIVGVDNDNEFELNTDGYTHFR